MFSFRDFYRAGRTAEHGHAQPLNFLNVIRPGIFRQDGVQPFKSLTIGGIAACRTRCFFGASHKFISG